MFSRLASRTLLSAGAIGTGVGFATMSSMAFADDSPNYTALRADIAAILEDETAYVDEGGEHAGPMFLRLAWHTSGTFCKKSSTGGSNGGTIRFSPERDHGANAGLTNAMRLLEPLKSKYPGVSYGDLYTLAGVVAVEEMAGPSVKWTPGRVDATKVASHTDDNRFSPDGRLPDADGRNTSPAQHLRDIFYRMGFTDQEIVALAGAHSLGRCHTSRSGYDGPWTRASTTFSNEYFRVLFEEKWVRRSWRGPEQFENVAGRDLMMLPTDMAIVEDESFRKHAEHYYKNPDDFERDFSAAFAKLIALGVPSRTKYHLFGFRW